MTPEQLADEFRLWKNLPITKAIMTELKERKEHLEELRTELHHIEDLADNPQNLGISYLLLSARIGMLDDVLTIDIVEIPVEEDEDD